MYHAEIPVPDFLHFFSLALTFGINGSVHCLSRAVGVVGGDLVVELAPTRVGTYKTELNRVKESILISLPEVTLIICDFFTHS